MDKIKTWQERTGNHNIRPGSVKHMIAEIAELRAALAARATPAQPVPDAVDTVLLEMQPGGALYQPPSPMDEKRLLDIARKMPQRPWGIGSRREDAIAFAWEVLKAAPSPASDVSAPSPSSVGAAIRALPLPEPWERGDGNHEDKYLESQVREFRSEAAAIAEQHGQQWISIADKMPESGKRVVFAWTNQLGKARTSMGQWNERWKQVANSSDEDACEYDEEQDEYFLLEGWQEWGWELEFSAYVEGKVTHWMPLPAAPSIAQDGWKSEGANG